MRSLALLLVATAACASPSAPPPRAPAAPPTAAPSCSGAVDGSSSDAFTASAVALLRCRLPGAAVTVKEPLYLAVDLPPDHHLYALALDRPWITCQSQAQPCDVALRAHVEGFVEMARTPTEVRPEALRAVIRSAGDVAAARATVPDLLVEPFVAGLFVVYAVDTPRTIVYASEATLAELGMTRAELFARARANLAGELGAVAAQVKDVPENGLGVIHTGSAYEPSRLLQHDDWAPVAARFHGNLLVTIPASDVVFYGDGTQPQARVALGVIAQDIVSKAPRPLSAAVLRWTPQGWVEDKP